MNLWEAKQAAFENTVRILDSNGWSSVAYKPTAANLTHELSEWYGGTKEKLQVNFMQFLGQMRDAIYDGLAADDMCVRFRDMCDAPRSRLKWPPDCEATLRALSLARMRRLCGFEDAAQAPVPLKKEDLPLVEGSEADRLSEAMVPLDLLEMQKCIGSFHSHTTTTSEIYYKEAPEWGDNLEAIPGAESADVVAILDLQRARALFDIAQEARELLPGVSFRAKATAGEPRVELHLLWPGSTEDMACALECLDDMLHEWKPDPGSWLTLCSEFT